MPDEVVWIAEPRRVDADIAARLIDRVVIGIRRGIGNVAVESGGLDVGDENRSRQRHFRPLEEPGVRVDDAGVRRAALRDVELAIRSEGEAVRLMP